MIATPPTRFLRLAAPLMLAVTASACARADRPAPPDAAGAAAIGALAARLEEGPRADLAGRAEGWASLDLATAPDLDLADLAPEAAARVNALRPVDAEAMPPAAPFVLQAAGPERERALLCLTQAIYYEAALEPDAGQAAVAQTVLNRLRHPAFPKSVCGVVYQGASLATGCQFSFTCDGSRERAPMAPFWQRAQAAARRALAGGVAPEVGTATAYHAFYVLPRWSPTLVKITQIGAHIFYRFPGPAGEAATFDRAYGGGEMKVSMAGPSPEAIAAARAGGAAAPSAPPDAETEAARPPAPEVRFGRRAPTSDEIARINAALAAMDKPQP